MIIGEHCDEIRPPTRVGIEPTDTTMGGLQIYTKKDLIVFNLLEMPVWVFDMERKKMWWANNSALRLWNAESLDTLLSRDFVLDMSQATEQQLRKYMETFEAGKSVVEKRTFFPKGNPTTVEVKLSGILVDDGKLALLNEGMEIIPKAGIDPSLLRSAEILRNLPVSVSQFDMDGNSIYDNPEAIDTFSMPAKQHRKRKRDGGLSEASSTFHSRFVDNDLAKRVFDQVSQGHETSVEARLFTKGGPRWSSIEVCKARDPVTGNPNILLCTRDITELIRAKKVADEANSRKSEFIAVMAHEIRTPLYQVTGFLDLLSQTSLDDEQRSHIKLLQGSCNNLMAVINDLLDYTRLEAGKMEIESLPFEPRAVVEGSVASISQRAEEKGIQLSTSIGAGLPVKVAGDPNRLRQIILNLLNNAVKFTHEGSINISLSSRKCVSGKVHIRFDVEDTGIGISESRQSHIFQTYYQADSSIARNYGGTGLGLAICKNLVKLMNGKIGVSSTVGKGSNFWFEIPFAPTDILRGTEDLGDGGKHPVGLKVLVAEDNKVNQKLAKALLEKLGHHVTIVENGELALKQVQSFDFDLVLMDIQMPVLDGIEATKEIRSRGLSCPVVGLTASFQRSDLPFYKQIGMDDCVSKPILLKDLARKIAEHTKREPLV